MVLQKHSLQDSVWKRMEALENGEMLQHDSTPHLSLTRATHAFVRRKKEVKERGGKNEREEKKTHTHTHTHWSLKKIKCNLEMNVSKAHSKRIKICIIIHYCVQWNDIVLLNTTRLYTWNERVYTQRREGRMKEKADKKTTVQRSQTDLFVTQVGSLQ